MTEPTADEVVALKVQMCRVEIVKDIDVPRGAWDWIDAIALQGEPPHRRIDNPNDAETIVYWQDEKPAAIVLNIRDQFNYSIQYRFDLRSSRPPAADAGEVREKVARANASLMHLEAFAEGDDLKRVRDAIEALALLSPTFLAENAKKEETSTSADIAQVAPGFREGVEASAKKADFAREHCNDGVGRDVAMKIAANIRAIGGK